MDDKVKSVAKILKSKFGKYNQSKKQYRRSLKTVNRRFRRKRNKITYYKHLKYKRKTEDLCSSVSLFNIKDMDWSSPSPNDKICTQISEWHNKEQISYWKSRALSLELENQMLQEHLRSVYAKQIEDYANSVENHKQINEKTDLVVNKKSKNVDKLLECKEDSLDRSIQQPVAEKRKGEMEKLYGKMAPKIMGMETAMQLNYELHNKPQSAHWPHMPLNLKFN